MPVARRERYEMPNWVRDAIAGHGLLRAYTQRPPFQQNDYVGWITSAKRQDTQQRRLAQILDELERGGVYMKMAWRVKDE